MSFKLFENIIISNFLDSQVTIWVFLRPLNFLEFQISEENVVLIDQFFIEKFGDFFKNSFHTFSKIFS